MTGDLGDNATTVLGAVVAAVAGLLVLVLLTVVTTITALTGGVGRSSAPAAPPGAPPGAPPTGAGSTPSEHARSDIPPTMLALYQQQATAGCPGLDWSVLAGIGSAETDHGRSRLPGVNSGENSAGAGGPMQFLRPTFAAVIAQHPPPPGGARPPSRYNAFDAVWAAASYLCDSGAPADLRRALFTYNRSSAYVQDVLARAAAYRAPGS